MEHSQEASDSGTQPLIVVTEDGSRWINVEDVEEMKWLMKEKRPMLENLIVKRRDSAQNQEIAEYDGSEILLYPEFEICAPNPRLVDAIIETKLNQTGSHSSSNKETQANDIINDIINRLRTIKKGVSVIKSIQSTMYSLYPVKRNKKPAMVKSTAGSKSFSLDVRNDENNKEKYMLKSQSTSSDVCVGSITKIQVVAEEMNSQYVKEKIVCVEYEVYKKKEDSVKKLRAYLALQSAGPKNNQYGNKKLTLSKGKNKTNEMQLTNEEIKMIDAEIKEKKGYLDHIRNVLKTDQRTKKHDRAVSTEDLPVNDEVLIYKRRVKNSSEVTTIQPQKAKQNSVATENKYFIHKTDTTPPPKKENPSPKNSRSKQFVKDSLKPKSINDSLLKTYYDIPNSNLDYIRVLLQKSNQKDKYLQCMRNLNEMDNFNEKMTSIYVNAY